MEVQARHGSLPTGRQQRLHGRPHHEPTAGGGDEWWEYFPCPFCYVEVEVPFLCAHLQEEHCFDMRNAVCPICAENLGADTAGHFREQHSQQLKMRKSSSSRAGAAADDKEAYEDEDSYFEESSYIMGRPVPDDHSPDPLLSQFICAFAPPPVVDPEPSKAEEEDHAAPSSDDQRLNQVVMDDASKEDLEERLRRVEFVKQMLMTTVAWD
ncbi:protein DEHYDRATION-INDUCED 19 homolog 6-like [Triticum dicoccoides]|uniref:protein DEHYDRATION-INDUCED 19 homolog 6-like n=1 Tax=Triticum dicoccoides TaxID=85692 RepID=UPI00188ED202|nr:protein DEHYDRATION-INDUCED 19 homolog 6-like [Triticum dicoccoides]